MGGLPVFDPRLPEMGLFCYFSPSSHDIATIVMRQGKIVKSGDDLSTGFANSFVPISDCYIIVAPYGWNIENALSCKSDPIVHRRESSLLDSLYPIIHHNQTPYQ